MKYLFLGFSDGLDQLRLQGCFSSGRTWYSRYKNEMYDWGVNIAEWIFEPWVFKLFPKKA